MKAGHFSAQRVELDDASLPRLVQQRDLVVPDVDGDHLFRALRRADRFPFPGKTLSGGEVRIVFVRQAAHQPATGAGNLRRVEREVLILGELQGDRLDLPEPGGAAEFSTATPHPTEQRGLVADADLPQLDACAERTRQIANELAEIHPTFGGEVEGELVPVPLPFRLGDLHPQLMLGDEFAGLPPHALLIGTQGLKLLDFFRSGATKRDAQRLAFRLRVLSRAAAGALLRRDPASRHYTPQVLSPFRLHDQPVAGAQGLVFRREVTTTVPLEAHFDDLTGGVQSRGGRDDGKGQNRIHFHVSTS